MDAKGLGHYDLAFKKFLKLFHVLKHRNPRNGYGVIMFWSLNRCKRFERYERSKQFVITLEPLGLFQDSESTHTLFIYGSKYWSGIKSKSRPQLNKRTTRWWRLHEKLLLYCYHFYRHKHLITYWVVLSSIVRLRYDGSAV